MEANKTHLPDQAGMAVDRTLMAATRTLMAWVRTGISQISFGFTIYKVLESFVEEGKLGVKHRMLTPRQIGMLFVLMGLFALVFGIFEYRSTYKEYGRTPKRGPLVMAGMIVALGILFFVAVVFHW